MHRSVGIGCEYLHVALDDHSHVAYLELLPDEHADYQQVPAAGPAAVSPPRVRVRRVLTDNGSGYRSQRFRATSGAVYVNHRRARPYAAH